VPTHWDRSVGAEKMWWSLKVVGGLLEDWAANLSQCAEARREGCGNCA